MPGNLVVVIVVGLRIAIGAVIAALVAVAMTPLFVLRDLSSGGTGLGLCADGIGACENSYFSGFEIVFGLALVLFVMVVGLGALLRFLRIAQRRDALRQGAPRGRSRTTGSLDLQ